MPAMPAQAERTGGPAGPDRPVPRVRHVLHRRRPHHPARPTPTPRDEPPLPRYDPPPPRPRYPDDYGRRRRYGGYLDPYAEPMPHRGGVILALGLTGFLLSCIPLVGWIMGGIAMSMASTDLPRIDRGAMDREGRGMTVAGQVCGIIAVVINSLEAFFLCAARKACFGENGSTQSVTPGCPSRPSPTRRSGGTGGPGSDRSASRGRCRAAAGSWRAGRGRGPACPRRCSRTRRWRRR